MADLPKEGGSVPAAAFPDEPFACPHCGQMLAPSCRVCPSCRNGIDPSEIVRLDVVIPIATQVVPLAVEEHVRFSWNIFFATLAIWLAGGLITERLVGPENGQLVLGGLVVLSSIWVLYDARQKNVPKPFRWSLGSFLLWIIVFPWYLARRRTPKASCPFIEGEGGRVARTLLFILLFFFLLSALMLILKGPSHPSGGKKTTPSGGQAPGGKIASLNNTGTVQAAASAPSEASQT